MNKIIMMLLIALSVNAYDSCSNSWEKMGESLEGLKISQSEKDSIGFKMSKIQFLHWNKEAILKCKDEQKAEALKIRKSMRKAFSGK